MTYKLYYSPGTASMPVHWTLIELGAPFEAVRIDFETGFLRTPEYLALNPLARVPVMLIDGVAHTESAALLMILTERHPDAGLAPPVGDPQRSKWLETMVFIANNLSPAMRDWFYADKDGAPEGAPAVRDLARRRIETIWTQLAPRLADGRPFLFGDRAGVVDFLVAAPMRWSRNMLVPANHYPELAAYLERLAALPSYQELCRREGLARWPA